MPERPNAQRLNAQRPGGGEFQARLEVLEVEVSNLRGELNETQERLDLVLADDRPIIQRRRIRQAGMREAAMPEAETPEVETPEVGMRGEAAAPDEEGMKAGSPDEDID